MLLVGLSASDGQSFKPVAAVYLEAQSRAIEPQMKNIAPTITRQRLLIEARYTIDVGQKKVKDFLLGLAKELHLRTYGEPIIHSPGGDGKEINQGFDAFVPLIDSGISLYVWSNERFLSCVLYTCKQFSVDDAIAFTKNFFKTNQLEFESF